MVLCFGGDLNRIQEDTTFFVVFYHERIQLQGIVDVVE